MQLYGPTGARLAQEDRNPTRIIAGDFGDITAAGALDSAVYTVPAIRRARILYGHVFGVVTTAFAVGQTADIRIQIQAPPAAILETLMRHFHSASAVGVRDGEILTGGWLTAADTLQARATITAGVGVLRVSWGFCILEFDA